MEVIKSCENCRWGVWDSYDAQDCDQWLCTNPESDHAWQAAVQDGYCRCYEMEKMCGTCRYCMESKIGRSVLYGCVHTRHEDGRLVELTDDPCRLYECGEEG